MTTVATKRWELVTSLSSATFAVRSLGLNTVRGQVPIRDGWVEVDALGHPIGVRAELDLSGLSTGNARRDADLRKPRLLDTDRFPTLLFEGRRGEPEGDGWQLPGRLSARGSDIALVLAASVTDRRSSDGRAHVHVHAATAFDRRSLGISAPRVLIGSRIAVTLDVVLRPTAA